MHGCFASAKWFPELQSLVSNLPTIRNGKLVGAVKHVLVNNPARGLTARLKNARSSRIREETERLAQRAFNTGILQNK
ncbi:SpoIVB peptidase S55 domain-containing protein [Butyricicoccus porcorum]|uniref:SpoIVB peptidase S55 domain-containing protein n=1 Tax=Butyricicoccus porcorum TaxID=1945634 RepID=UPI000D5266A9